MAPRGRVTQLSRGTRETNKAKQPALFPIEMIAMPQLTQSSAQQNIEHF